MKNSKSKKAHSVGSALIVVILIMSIFAFGLYTGNNNSINYNNQNNENNQNKITAAAVGMEKISGMAEDQPPTTAPAPAASAPPHATSNINPNDPIAKIIEDVNKKTSSSTTPTGTSKMASSQEISRFRDIASRWTQCLSRPNDCRNYEQLEKQYYDEKTKFEYRTKSPEDLFDITREEGTDKSLAQNALDWKLKNRDGATITYLFDEESGEGQKLLARTIGRDKGLENVLKRDYLNQYNELKIGIEEDKAAKAQSLTYDSTNQVYVDRQGNVYEPTAGTTGTIFKKTGEKIEVATTATGQKANEKLEELKGQIIGKEVDYGDETSSEIVEVVAVGNEFKAKDANGFLYSISNRGEVLEDLWSYPQSIKAGNNKEAKRVENLLQMTDYEFAVYKTSDGTLYNQKGEAITDSVTKVEKISADVRILETIKVDKGKVGKDVTTTKIQSGDSNPIDISPIVKAQVISAVKSAGKEPTIEGSLDDDGNALTISNEKGVVSKITRTSEGGDEINGFKIESQFLDDQPLNIFRTSPDGKVTLKEIKESKEIETGQKDADGKPIKEKYIITKEWIKEDAINKERIVRTYEVDEKTGKQKDDQYKELMTNSKTGEPKQLKYSENHPRFGKEKEDLEILKTQYTSRQYFAKFESILTDYAGLGYYATLFFEDEDLDAWRENVDKTFATLYLGTEYWTSDICAVSTDIDRSSQGVAYVDTKLGLAAVAAHIEASRSEQLIGPGTEDNSTGIVMPTREYLYKITFNVKNGDYESDPKALEIMRFNIFLKGDRTAKLFRNDVEVEKGDRFGHIGRAAIVQYSRFFYDKICIEFETTPSSWRLDDDELCNTIMGPSGPTSAGTAQQQPSQQQESGEGDILDI
ncbi:hypothetical protein HYU09_00940 [Candidatus Woesearchaeota archaeon]|nr:hypothetical protein [Candidatus Woesearchaeota archaeon]